MKYINLILFIVININEVHESNPISEYIDEVH